MPLEIFWNKTKTKQNSDYLQHKNTKDFLI